MAPDPRRRARHVDYASYVREQGVMNDRVLWGLIAANVLVFVLWTQARGTVLELLLDQHFLVSVDSIAEYRFWTLLTSEFSHYDPRHLLFNMLGLYFFGRPVAEALGWRDLLGLYVASGVVASLGHVIYGIVTGDQAPALGASGAVSGLGVCFAALFPNTRILVNFIFPMPAPMAVGLFLLLDVLGILGGGGNVAHAAHLAGAATGLAWFWLRGRR